MRRHPTSSERNCATQRSLSAQSLVDRQGDGFDGMLGESVVPVRAAGGLGGGQGAVRVGGWFRAADTGDAVAQAAHAGRVLIGNDIDAEPNVMAAFSRWRWWCR